MGEEEEKGEEGEGEGKGEGGQAHGGWRDGEDSRKGVYVRL